jgi:tripartite-type tricarboxylate transporter receptor subunit TctC
LLTASILKRYGLSGTIVPFKGGPDAVTALAQNELHFVLSAVPLLVPFKGRIRPIVITSDFRSPIVPDVPTFKEAGFDAPTLNYYGGFAVPAATPKTLIEASYKPATEAMRTPTLIQKYAQQGMLAQVATGDAMAKIIADELEWMTPIASELNLKAG